MVLTCPARFFLRVSYELYLSLSLSTICADVHSNISSFGKGHIMHGLCAEGEGNSTRLAKCPRDFVEAPSQMLENWCWQPIVLQRLSKHHTTGESLPEELLQSLVAAKNVNEGLFMMRQICLGTLDLYVHAFLF